MKCRSGLAEVWAKFYEAKPEVELDELKEPRDIPFKFMSGQV